MFAGKAFDITYVRLKFHTSRPESFSIYRRSSEDGPWLPYQFYSGSCEKTYQKPNRGFIRTGDNEQQALCTDDFSDISPLTGGNVAFSTLEGRPSAYNFDNSPVLQVSQNQNWNLKNAKSFFLNIFDGVPPAEPIDRNLNMIDAAAGTEL